ncbi:MAG: retroviral-like aspartic protease family protein [Gammaproteobacteria bacterium]|nr:retroviral-like aspartic protease family protein [Gammaproteobacteria bacterium]MCP5198396.1 retroviral-like aspartic protease family protein [Gammaproteobacteria bacterium]
MLKRRLVVERGGVYQTPANGRTRLVLALALALVATALPAAPQVSAVALFKGMAVLRIDGTDATLREGQAHASGVRLLAATAHRAVVEVEGETLELDLDDRIEGGHGMAAAPAVVRLLPGAQGRYFADGQINGNPVRFVVDTGATTVVVNRREADRLGLRYDDAAVAGSMDSASGSVPVFRVTLREVKVQGLRVSEVSALVVDGDGPYTPLLGQSFLKNLDMHRKGQVLELRARAGTR